MSVSKFCVAPWQTIFPANYIKKITHTLCTSAILIYFLHMTTMYRIADLWWQPPHKLVATIPNSISLPLIGPQILFSLSQPIDAGLGRLVRTKMEIALMSGLWKLKTW